MRMQDSAKRHWKNVKIKEVRHIGNQHGKWLVISYVFMNNKPAWKQKYRDER